MHNLQNIDLDVPLGKLVVITGVSGAGKSSLAFDTLYAEGQRRYVESFSTYSRRFLERFEKPDADRIEPIPPVVAVRQKSGQRSRRATVGTATEVYDSLRLLFARLGSVECPRCRRAVVRHTPATAQRILAALPKSTRYMICFPALSGEGSALDEPRPEAGALAKQLAEAGFTRVIAAGRSAPLDQIGRQFAGPDDVFVVVDRLTAGSHSDERLADSLELAFRHGDNSCAALVQTAAPDENPSPAFALERIIVDGVGCQILSFNGRLVCSVCGTEFADPEPPLFNFNSPLGACPACRGMGEVAAQNGERGKMRTCPACLGTRLRPEALAVRVAGRTIAEMTQLTASELLIALDDLRQIFSDEQRTFAERILTQARARLEFLDQMGLAYLTLDRPARSLSGGQAQRVRLTAALGSNFVNMLYVLDEPTAGLHPRDTERLLSAIERLRDAGNTVVVVEHDAMVIRRADHAIEIGPGAGRDGGRIVFQGHPDDLASSSQTVTGDFLGERRQIAEPAPNRRTPTGWLSISGIEHHNLQNVSVEFPLGVLCVVTGVSGSGKSSLVEEALYPAVAAHLQQCAKASDGEEEPIDRARSESKSALRTAGRFRSLAGLEQLDQVLLIDQSPIGRSGRGNPASFLNLFGEIRSLFAGTAEAKVHNFTAAHFSFNSAGGGRCETCRGTGSVAVDMQFLPDIVMTCPDCHGSRFRREILEARYRGLSIAEVLGLTVREAFGFFRGRSRLQRRLKILKDVGLDYIALGQPADTLSGGESQRLKLAAFLSRAGRSRTLFIVDEPTTGLHQADIAHLLDCLGTIIAGGHSLVVIEHNLDFIRRADYVIDLGPDAGTAGGRVVAAGTPEDIARAPDSITSRFLAGGRPNARR